MLNLATIVLLALAAYRGTQLVVHDSIGDPVRDRLIAWHEHKPTARPRGALVTLITCTYCAGAWISAAALAAWLTISHTWPDRLTPATAALLLLNWFAVAGGQSLLNRWDDTRDRNAA